LQSTKIIALSVATLLLAALPAASQTTSGSIAGAVHDQQDAAVANATVVVTDQDKKTASTATTDANGRFAFPQLQPGVYSVNIKSPGFKSFERLSQCER
jgi:uncharacterized lipoprotein YajG